MWRLKLLWDRLNVICAWPLFVIVDLGIAWTRVQTWTNARAYSNYHLRKVWNQALPKGSNHLW